MFDDDLKALARCIHDEGLSLEDAVVTAEIERVAQMNELLTEAEAWEHLDYYLHDLHYD